MISQKTKKTLALAILGGSWAFCSTSDTKAADASVPAEIFCSNTYNYFSTALTQSEVNMSRQEIAKTVVGFVQLIREGNMSEYFSMEQLLGTKTGIPPRYIGVAQMLTNVLNLNPTRPVILVMGDSDLRFLPNTQENSQIVLVLKNADLFKNENIFNSVVSTAQRLKISLNILWTGPSEAVLVPTKLATSTGGVMLDVSATKNICSP